MIIHYKGKDVDADIQAIYLGRIRVGYLTKDTKRERPYLWWLSVLRPEGGGYTGRAGTLTEAKAAISASLREWVDAAMDEGE